MKTKPIDKSMLDELKNHNTLTVARQNEILGIINTRVDEIFRFICDAAGAKLNWYSYSTDDRAYCSDGDGSDGGVFDINQYETDIWIIGDWSENLCEFEECFPTRFLWEDYEDEVLKDFSKVKEEDWKFCLKLNDKVILDYS